MLIFTYRLLVIAGMLIFILGGCKSDEVTPTSIAALATVEVTRPTLTNTAVPPILALGASGTAVPITPTRTPQPTQTPQPTITRSITPIPVPVWASDITVLIEVEDRDVAWSPTANEFLSFTCQPETDDKEASIIFERATAPEFEPQLLLQFDSACLFFLDKIWSPDGQSIIFSGPLTGVENGLDYSDESEVWITDRNGQNPYSLGPGEFIRWPNFLGWLNERTIAYSGYSAGGSYEASILDVTTGELLASGFVHGSFHYPSKDYLPGDDGMDYWGWVSAVAISPDINEKVDDNFYDRYMRFLSFDRTYYQYEFYSHFEDWLPGTNQMLVLTWEEPVSLNWKALFEYGPYAQLQLWDVDNDSLIPLVTGGVHGRFSPDGQTLSFLTVDPLETGTSNPESLVNEQGEPFFYRHLMDMSNREVYLSLPSNAEVDSNGGPVVSGDSFSEDGRYFAFFTPGSVIVDDNEYPVDVQISQSDGEARLYLNIYEISTGKILYSIQASNQQLVWSPNSDRLFFQNLDGNLAILNLEDGRQTLLTTDRGSQPSRVQWSFDGTYISITTTSVGEWKTYVLLAPG